MKSLLIVFCRESAVFINIYIYLKNLIISIFIQVIDDLKEITCNFSYSLYWLSTLLTRTTTRTLKVGCFWLWLPVLSRSLPYLRTW